MVYEMKPHFEERMKKLLPDSQDFEAFNTIIHTEPRNFIRCNTLKISPEELKVRLEKKWQVSQPFSNYPEIFVIETDLLPGELGNSIEHLAGYYYVQEISSMLSVLALDPKPGEFIFDMCASPGSKTTQIAARMHNSGTIIANDVKLDRIRILAANTEKCGVSNCIITKNDAADLASRMANKNMKFDRILLDAPCSGEGTLRSSPRTFRMWNHNMIKKFSRMQKKLLERAIKCLKQDGILVYSTCTHAPEENEHVVNYALENFPLEIESLSLPLKCRPGITGWNNETYTSNVQKACRIYPQDNDSEGFFVARFRLKEELA